MLKNVSRQCAYIIQIFCLSCDVAWQVLSAGTYAEYIVRCKNEYMDDREQTYSECFCSQTAPRAIIWSNNGLSTVRTKQ